MNKISVLIVEDEAPAMKRLLKLVDKNPQLKLVDTAKSAAEAGIKIPVHRPDLLLLDIQLKDATAFDMLAGVKNQFQGKVIFITAYDRFAVRAFELEAVDYLLKPFSRERFDQAIDRVISKTEIFELKKLVELFKSGLNNQSKMIEIPEGNKMHFIEKEKIMYLCAEGYYTYFIESQEKKMIRISLKKLEEILPADFLRINKSTIINKKYIMELTRNKNSGKVTMNDKNEFFISEKFVGNL